MTSSIEMTPAQEYIFVSRYSRWNDELGRRESWSESVDRYFKFMKSKFPQVPKKVWERCTHHVTTMGSMPSMRAFWTAGPALEKNSIVAYNCCSLVIKDVRSFAELFYILMCGTGVGFSVEREFITQLPVVPQQTGAGRGVYVVDDSREGWANSLLALFEALFSGSDIEFDYSKIRPRGARLKTMGGRASGPDPLKKLHNIVRETVLAAQLRQLTSLECLDICNHIGDVVVVGGVRRAAEISFSDLDDMEMRGAKVPPFPQHRQMSNNSAVYYGKPSMVDFMAEWTSLAASNSGERGIFNAEAAMRSCERRLIAKLGWEPAQFLKYLRTNPCGEILLMALLGQFCNLTEVVVRAGDTFDDLCEKVKAAVWMGAMQASLTDFPFLRPSFREVCEEERLLGVSLTGQMDNPALMTPELLKALKQVAVKECRKACRTLNIKMSAAITTGKPSGTVSQLVNCASGAHARFARWYLRRYRNSSTDPLYRMLRDQGLPFSPENGQGPEKVELEREKLIKKGRSAAEAKILVPDWDESQVLTWVCSFPEAAPAGSITRDQVTAIGQLEWYLKLKQNWCEHNQSMTVYVQDSEWLSVGDWVYSHFDEIVGISFLPYDGGIYPQAPYLELTEQEYNQYLANFPKINYSQLAKYEMEDNTTGAQLLACSAGGCELT